MLLVTFHGGNSGYTNVHCYADSGSNSGECLEDHVLQGDWPSHTDAELRGISLYQEKLWVTNGAKGSSGCVMIFNPPAGTSKEAYQCQYQRSFVSAGAEPAINHPFAFTFDGRGNCYLSNQDTNVVAWFSQSGSANPSPGCLPVAPSPQPNYLPGSFIASSTSGVDGSTPTVPVPQPAGLDSLFDGKKQHSVRDVLYYPGWNVLLVCDEAASQVKVYAITDSYLITGSYLGMITGAWTRPTHLLIEGNVLYIAASGKSGGNVATYTLGTLPTGPSWTALSTNVIDGGLQAAAGMAFDADKNLYIADRTARSIHKYTQAEGRWQQQQFITGLRDDPEFLFHLESS